jgi:antitoxin FitA
MVQIRNMPTELHRKLKARAAAHGMSLSDYLLSEVQNAATKLTPNEIAARLDRIPPFKGKESPTAALRAEREGR